MTQYTQVRVQSDTHAMLARLQAKIRLETGKAISLNDLIKTSVLTTFMPNPGNSK